MSLGILLVALTASAGEPAISELPAPNVREVDGAILGEVRLAVPAETVRSKMADPTWLPRATGSTTQVRVEGADGPCQLVHSESPSTFLTAKYDTRRCPTQSGFRSTLRDSNCFKAYTTEWSFVPTADGGTLATYRLDLTSSLMMVPQSVVRRSSLSAVTEMLTRLQGWSKDPR